MAEEDGKMAGWIGWTLKPNSSEGRKYTYLAEVIVHPDFRRSGLATELVKAAEKNALDAGSDHIYCYIYETNRASKSLFEGMGYKDVLDAKICEMSAYKKASVSPEISIERLNKDEIGDLASFINDYNKERAHFEPYTPESLEYRASQIPGYGLENIWVAKEGGKIAACAGLWDSSTVADNYYAREPLMWKVMGGMLKALGHFAAVPKMPSEGEPFKLYYITDYAFQSQGAMSALLGHINNLLIEAKRDYLAAVLDPKDQIFEVTSKLKPQVEEVDVYAKSLKGGLSGFSPFYVDIRDMIL